MVSYFAVNEHMGFVGLDADSNDPRRDLTLAVLAGPEPGQEAFSTRTWRCHKAGSNPRVRSAQFVTEAARQIRTHIEISS
jgi:hypothetical protein